MEDSKMYITKEVIENKEHSEIDFLIQDEFGLKWEDEQVLIELMMGNPDVTNEPINIDLMIKTLQEMKEKGSTHVSLHYHIDHIGYEMTDIGYEMTGYKIYHSTEEQINVYEEKLSKKLKKEKKLKALREEYNKIANE
jgi:hypothetical protein